MYKRCRFFNTITRLSLQKGLNCSHILVLFCFYLLNKLKTDIEHEYKVEHSAELSSVFCSSGVGRESHLYASLRQVDGEGQPLPHADVWVLALLEGFLQRLQLRHAEGGAAAALLLLVAVPSLQNQLWQQTHKCSGVRSSPEVQCC